MEAKRYAVTLRCSSRPDVDGTVWLVGRRPGDRGLAVLVYVRARDAEDVRRTVEFSIPGAEVEDVVESDAQRGAAELRSIGLTPISFVVAPEVAQP